MFFQDLPGEAQSVSTGKTNYEKPVPQWLKDLRRADIIFFGSFPFTFFFSTTAMDLYRSSQHNWDTRYAPWPVKSAGAINMTTDEFGITIGIAAGGAFLVALADHIIVRIKRRQAEMAAARLPPGDPIIIKRPYGGVPEESPQEPEVSPDNGEP
jgi:hypothetical protein